jgi:hypothetical protein
MRLAHAVTAWLMLSALARAGDAVVPGQITIGEPTFHCLGFE